MKNYILQLALILLTGSIFAQHPNGNRCCSSAVRAQKISEDDAYRKQRVKLHQSIEEYLEKRPKDLVGDVIVIPVVFHIFHNGDPIGMQENISEDLINAQLEQINNDFRRLNADTTSTPLAFDGLASDTQIEFCLTAVDLNNDPTDGINRYDIDDFPSVQESECWTTDYIDDNLVRPTIWDRDKYLNIYSVIGIDAFENGTCQFFANLGYAQFPGGDPNTDAVVLSFFSMGSLDQPNPIFSEFKGRTATHEVGHWLDLEHPWGPGNGGCQEDDGYQDTPVQDQPAFGCPSFPSFDSCTPTGDGIMSMNFMNYVDDECMNLFTADQREWMRALVFNGRASLITATCASSTLSIEDVSQIKATPINDDVIVEWHQSLSSDVTEMIIDHTMNIPNFEPIGTKLKDQDQRSTYNNFLHGEPTDGTHYYRIRYRNEYGGWNHSKIVSATLEKRNSENIILQNPVEDMLTLIRQSSESFLKYHIFSLEGKSLMEGSFEDSRMDINVSNFPEGLYLVSLRSATINKIQTWIKK